jgi:cupin 2 domain-containing protein
VTGDLRRGNLFDDVPSRLPAERFDRLLETPGLMLERIVSTGHATPPGEWWDQDRDEWVVLLRGGAELRFADRDDVVALRPGDWVLIPAHRRHRVERTDPHEPTVWLALHHAARPP